MLKKLIRTILEMTPYTIVRKKNTSIINDPLDHNTPQGMDKLFSSTTFLTKYRSQHRITLYEYINSKILSKHPLTPSEDVKLKIADFGCGPGLFLQYIANTYSSAELFGFEYSQVALDIAKQNCPGAFLIQYDLTLPIDQQYQQFDCIVCSQTLEHINFPNIALANIVTALKPGGRIIITVPDGRVDTYNGHLNFWSPESFKVWMRDQLPEEATVEFDVLSKGSGFDYLIAIIDLN